MSKSVRRVTAADIARMVGVAKSTVSLAFSAPDRVSAPTLDRILKTAEKYGYTPNPVAQSLKTGRNNLVGLVLHDLTNPHGGAVLQHVQNTANDNGYMVMTATAMSDPENDLRFVRRFELLNIRSAIIMPSGGNESYLSELLLSPMRFVTYGHKLAELQCDHVGLDNALAMQLLVRHLLDLGHRKIGHIAGSQALSSGIERLAGMRKSLTAAGLELEERYVGHGNYDEHSAYEATHEILAQDDRPTALVTANNATAIGALRAVKDLQLNCPDDVSIATVDQLHWSDLMSPQITCAAQPIDKMAKLAATWLIDRLENENNSEPPRLCEFAPTLIVAESTRSRY